MSRTFVIDRRIWLRGEPTGYKEGSFLLRSTDQKMCCVGIYLKACGVPPKVLEDEETATNLVFDGHKLPEEARWLMDERESSRSADALYDANDDSSADEVHREDTIRQLFAKHGVKVKFTNAPKAP